MALSPDKEKLFRFRLRLEQEMAQKKSITPVDSNVMPQEKADIFDYITPGGRVTQEKINEAYPVSKLDAAALSVAKAGQDVATIPAHFFNQIALNAPRSLVNTYTGFKYPEKADNELVNKAAKVAGFAGLIKSPISKAIEKIPGKGVLSAMTKGAVGGAVYSPTENFGDIKERAIVGSVSAAGGGLINQLAKTPQALKSAAVRTVNSLIKPITKNFSYAKNPGRGIVDEGIIATSFDDLANKVNQSEQKVWKEYQTKIASVKNTADLSDITSPIDDEIVKLSKTPRTNKALINRLNETKDDLLGALGIKGGKIRTNIQALRNMTPQQILDLKQAIGQVTKWTGSPSDDQAVNTALKRVYGKSKEALSKLVPGSDDLSEKLADLISAKSAIRHREAVLQRSNMVGIAPKLGAYLASSVAGTTQGGPMGGLAAPLALFAADKIASSVPAKTGMAQFLKQASRVKLPKGTQEVVRRGLNPLYSETL